jgi:hypothetical protein
MKVRIVLFLLALISFSNVQAQCAMCKATVEKGETTQAPIEQRTRGLNNGILYMMTIPYLLAGVIAYLWYQNSKKERERKDEIKRIIRSKMSPM